MLIIKKKRLTFIFIFLIAATNFQSLKLFSQVESSTQKMARESFKRFFEVGKALPITFDTTLSKEEKDFQIKIQKTTNKQEQFKRLLSYQENRIANYDISKFLRLPIFAEVAFGEVRDFAQVDFWNWVAMDATATDHTPLPPGSIIDNHPFEQVGPARTSRAMAIVHIAIFEALNSVYREYQSYNGIQDKIFEMTGIPRTVSVPDVSIRHAIAFAGYHTLINLYPEKKSRFDLILGNNLARIQVPENQRRLGEEIGTAAAKAILDMRKLDGAELPEPPAEIFQSNDRWKWKKDPLNNDPNVALGANWRYVKPFVLQKPDQFRPPTPPSQGSEEFKKAYAEVFTLGGDPHAGESDPPGNADRRQTTTTRTNDQTFIGIYWAYDGTALLCAPPRLYNMIATSLAKKEKREIFSDAKGALNYARLLALINVAMADAGIAAWEAKYYYLYPRPVTAIRAVENSRFWAPLGAPVTNGRAGRLNFTPPFPAYPSGHATFGGALFQILRKFFGTDSVVFEFISDEYNGLNSGAGEATPRPRTPIVYNNFTDPEKQNADSRIYLGIHWRFDAEQGIIQGNGVADFIFGNIYPKL